MSKSFDYQLYLNNHINAVKFLYEKLTGNKLLQHDESKFSDEEFIPYREYWYGDKDDPKVRLDFDYAWLHHQHNNPHHWQYWILKNDDEVDCPLEMPKQYVAEMVSDWASFALVSGDLTKFTDWWESHKSHIILHDNTHAYVEYVLVPQMVQILNKEIPFYGHEEV